MKLVIRVDLDNAAFGDLDLRLPADCDVLAQQVRWVFEDSLFSEIESGDLAGNLRDQNGNTVGTWRIE